MTPLATCCAQRARFRGRVALLDDENAALRARIEQLEKALQWIGRHGGATNAAAHARRVLGGQASGYRYGYRYDLVWSRGEEDEALECIDLTAEELANRLVAAVRNSGFVQIMHVERKR